MRRTFVALALAGLVSSLIPMAPTQALPRGTRVQLFKRANFPVDMAWVRGTKRVFYTEKNTGKVRVLIGRRLFVTRRGGRITRRRTILRGPQIVDVSTGPRGWLYFLTPNSIRRIIRR